MALTEAQMRSFLGDLVAALDTGKYGHIAIEDVERHIEGGDLVAYLTEQLGEDVDVVLTPEAPDQLNARYLDLWLDNHGREWRKWGIRNSGLCLLVAWGLTLLSDFELWGRDTQRVPGEGAEKATPSSSPSSAGLWRGMMGPSRKQRPN